MKGIEATSTNTSKGASPKKCQNAVHLYLSVPYIPGWYFFHRSPLSTPIGDLLTITQNYYNQMSGKEEIELRYMFSVQGTNYNAKIIYPDHSVKVEDAFEEGQHIIMTAESPFQMSPSTLDVHLANSQVNPKKLPEPRSQKPPEKKIYFKEPRPQKRKLDLHPPPQKKQKKNPEANSSGSDPGSSKNITKPPEKVTKPARVKKEAKGTERSSSMVNEMNVFKPISSSSSSPPFGDVLTQTFDDTLT